MQVTRRAATLAGFGLLSSVALPSRGVGFEGPLMDLVQGGEELAIASDAYIYGYPLVTMELTRRVITNVAEVAGTRGPMGSIIRLRAYPDATFRDVTAPNADTLYTTSFFDVGDEPWVLSVPDMKGRYFLLPLLSGWTDVFNVPGTRTTGHAGADLPDHAGRTGPARVPAGMTQLKSPTSIVWLLGRIYCTGTPRGLCGGPCAAGPVQASAAQHMGQALHGAGGQGRPGDRHEDGGARTGEQAFHRRVLHAPCRTAEAQSARAADAPALERFERIGLEAGKSFDPQYLDSRWDKRIPEVSQGRIMAHFLTRDGDMTRVNGWSYTTKAGVYGTNYFSARSSPTSGLAPTGRRMRSTRRR